MRKNFIFKMSVVFVMGIMALGQVSCSSKTETNVDKEGEASSESQGDVFFQTRGIILSWDDVKKPEVLDWLKLSENAGITTLSVFGADIYSAEYQEFVSKCREKSIDIEYQEHMMATLLPRDLFKEHPAYFRMDENGQRTADFNCCPSSEEALSIIAANAKVAAQKCTSSNNKYYYWLDDGGKRCHCKLCDKYNDSDQALLIENQIIRALKEVNPQAKLAHLAYQGTIPAPEIVKPENDIFLEFAPFNRRWDKPLRERDAIRDGMTITHGEYIDALEANLKVFPKVTAQVLEYWMDVSLFSDWKKPAVQLPWNKNVFLSDINTYAHYGIRNIIAYAVYVDAIYYETYKNVNFVQEYGDGLKNYRLPE